MPTVKLIPTDQCPPGQGVFVRAADRGLAVFHLADPDRFAVIDNTCPHAGGSLSAGELEGTRVSCPYHYWQFDVLTGASTHSSAAQVRSYPAEVRDGYVWAEIDAD